MIYARPEVEYDDHDRVITIEGVKYAYEFFGVLGFRGAAPGTALKIIKRENGVLTVEQLQEKPA